MKGHQHFGGNPQIIADSCCGARNFAALLSNQPIKFAAVHGLKKSIAQFLNARTNRHRFNDCFVYQTYVLLTNPAHAKQKKLELSFYEELIGENRAAIFFDIGANVGSKTAVFRQIARKVISVEPTPSTVEMLRRRFEHKRNVVVVPKGVSSRPGQARLHVFANAGALNTFSSFWVDALQPPDRATGSAAVAADQIIDVPTTTLDELIREYGVPFFIKIDAEGYELEVLKGLTAEVSLLSFEANLPVFLEQILDCILLLTARWPHARFNYVTEDPPSSFEMTTWLTGQEMKALVEKSGKRYMEIYFKAAGLN